MPQLSLLSRYFLIDVLLLSQLSRYFLIFHFNVPQLSRQSATTFETICHNFQDTFDLSSGLDLKSEGLDHEEAYVMFR